MKSIFSLIISAALVVSGYAQTRNVLVGTNNAVVQPTNFWSADASSARTGLGLGSAATNAASAFQPSSISLSNLASNNGGGLTNLQATNLVGLISTSNIPPIVLTNIGTVAITQGGTGATNAANARQNLGSTSVGDALFIATNVSSARATLGATTVGSSVFTAVDEAAARTALSLGTASTNPATAFQFSSLVLSNLASSNAINLTNLRATNIVGVIPSSNIPTISLTNISGTLSVASGGTGATNAGVARTNLGLGATNNVAFNSVYIGAGDLQFSNDSIFWSGALRYSPEDQSFEGSIAINNGSIQFIGTNAAANIAATRTNLGLGATWLTNTNVTNFRTAIGLGALGSVVFEEVLVSNALEVANGAPSGITIDADGIQFGATNAAITRSNLGLGWPALTNSNAGIGLVSVNTNGDVVSPTNFWQRAPIQTTVQDFTGITVSQTNNATNSRNVYVYSLATNVSGISNTIILPTNALTFNGDEVTIVHKGTTNTTTVVRQAGSTNNLITLNRFDESVKFIRELGQWDFYHNISFVEPIQFSGTNASANVAASRTNLGLGATNRPLFNGVVVGDIANNPTTAFIANSQSDEVHYAPDGITFYSQTNASHNIDMANAEFNNANTWTFNSAIGFGTTTNAATTRTNLGLGLPALTNTSVTNFQKAIFYTNTAPSNIGGNLGTIAAWIEIVASNGVTYKIPAYTNVP